jgi:hypothetical protein
VDIEGEIADKFSSSVTIVTTQQLYGKYVNFTVVDEVSGNGKGYFGGYTGHIDAKTSDYNMIKSQPEGAPVTVVWDGGRVMRSVRITSP